MSRTKYQKLNGSDGEATLRALIMARLNHLGHATNHEDKWTSGVPDISWSVKGRDGWVELKHVYGPRKMGDRFPHQFRPAQLLWAKKRISHTSNRLYAIHRFQEVTEVAGPVEFLGLVAMPDWLEALAKADGRLTLADYYQIATYVSVDPVILLDRMVFG